EYYCWLFYNGAYDVF
nr:immunoglobulin light chain junction region [Macaca mulatta]MOX36271.1 immunoglobulin light chain junction region [Macaca mulatta]